MSADGSGMGDPTECKAQARARPKKNHIGAVHASPSAKAIHGTGGGSWSEKRRTARRERTLNTGGRIGPSIRTAKPAAHQAGARANPTSAPEAIVTSTS